MTRKYTGTVYMSSAAVEIAPPLPRHIRPSAKLPSELISAVNAIVMAPMKKLLPNWGQKSFSDQYPAKNPAAKALSVGSLGQRSPVNSVSPSGSRAISSMLKSGRNHQISNPHK